MFLFSPYFSFHILRISAKLTHLSILHSFKVLLHKMWSKELQRGCYLELVKMQVTGPTPELQSQNLHFKRRFLCILQLENHQCQNLKLIHENDIKHQKEFPESPMVRTQYLHCCDLSSIASWGTKISQAAWCSQYMYPGWDYIYVISPRILHNCIHKLG